MTSTSAMTQTGVSIDKVRERIARAAKLAGRHPESVMLLAVSKTKPACAIREAYAAGQGDFGENYLQEALDKQRELNDLPLIWHFIGPIQSNKTRAIAEQFDWVHSVDRLKIAQRVSEQRPPDLPPLQICLQVNISNEPSKSGCSPDELPTLMAEVNALPRLQLRGLMAIPDHSSEIELSKAFAAMQALLKTAQTDYPALDTLSMGMSADLELAIRYGATIVRVGSDIFGARN
jgi:pyridoxal phosphate enzyme (YggS family)